MENLKGGKNVYNDSNHPQLVADKLRHEEKLNQKKSVLEPVWYPHFSTINATSNFINFFNEVSCGVSCKRETSILRK
jgi:hypothetical protein